MQLRRVAVGMALVAMVVAAGCSRGGDGDGGGGGSAGASEAQRAPATDQAADQVAGAAGRPARAWATAMNGLGVMAAAVLVGVVWLVPLLVVAGLVLLVVRSLRRPQTTA
jgi:hypothetical protein